MIHKMMQYAIMFQDADVSMRNYFSEMINLKIDYSIIKLIKNIFFNKTNFLRKKYSIEQIFDIKIYLI